MCVCYNQTANAANNDERNLFEMNQIVLSGGILDLKFVILDLKNSQGNL